MSDSESDASSDNELGDLKGKGKTDDNESRTIVQAGFDAYFTLSAAKGATSSNLFSSLVQPLSADEYLEGIAYDAPGAVSLESAILREPQRSTLFSRMLAELNEGFNTLCYGFGSKRDLLDDFARTRCAKAGHVVVVNGFHPELSLKDMLHSIENVPGITALPLASNTPDAQTRRIHDFFSQSKVGLYLIVHNLDTFLMRTPKAKPCLSVLALHPNIHLVASVDHINAPLLWSASESAARKRSGGGGALPRGFAWLWHDVTTLAPYDAELAFADRTSITGARGRKARADAPDAPGAGVPVSDTAVQHVLAAVTDRAKRLFVLMGERQLKSIDAEGSDPHVDALQAHGVTYDALFPLARAEYISTIDTQLRAQLGEFRDHHLIVSAQVGASEVLWIPMRKERLAKILASIETTS
ncbi:DNA replication origin binding protein [Mycena kentingensis (nom. inval.)]|nr:DNA replication origin binding protein [Mycena kentingensis (nom. inval.)]